MTMQGDTIPARGNENEAVLAAMRGLADGDVQWERNRAFGLVYHHSEGHTELVKKAHHQFFSTNALNPMAFGSLQRMEHDVIRMTAKMLHGDDEVVGTMSAGGTDSILLAVYTYRQYARRHKPWIRLPEIVVPESAHASFFKGGEFFDVKVVKTPLDSDYRANVAAMAEAINENTIALVGSATCYPYGVIDPIEELSALAVKHELPLHVDGCIGGFMLPWIEKLEPEHQLTPIPPFNFRVPGVTSMSADLHKYGYAAKGASAIMYRGMKYLRCQFSAATDWCGGIYASPTFAGTRPGSTIAAAWASLQGLGEEGFIQNARKTMDVTKKFYEGINAIPELEVLGKPAMPILAFGSPVKGFSTYAVGDYLEGKNWHIDRLQYPESLHLILNPGHGEIVDQWLADLRDAVAHVKAHPDAAFEGSAPMYGLIAKAPMRSMVKQQVLALFEGMYSAEGKIPDMGAVSIGEGDGDGEDTPAPRAAEGIPKPVIVLMKLWARVKRLVGM